VSVRKRPDNRTFAKGSAIENGNFPTFGPPGPNQVSAPIKYVTDASNGEIGEIFGKLTYSAIAKISQSFSE
jgi:hypothetical protein